MELGTTGFAERGQADIRVRFDDERLSGQVERWVTELQARGAAGEVFKPDRLVVLDGWPLLPVAHDGGLVLHALDLSTAADAPPRYLERVDELARFASEQREVAEAFDLTASFDPPHYLMRVDVCPHWKKTGEYVLARIPPLEPNHSGWALKCGTECHLAPNHEKWTAVSVSDLCQHRSGLVRYLALQVGIVVYSSVDGPRVGVAQVATDTNVARLPLRYRELLDLVEPIAEKPDSAFRARRTREGGVTLDPLRDGDVYDAASSLSGIPIVVERYCVSPEIATRVVERAWTREGRRARVRARFRDQIPEERFAEIEAALADPDPARWRVHNAAGRKLRELTGGPFAQLKELAAKLDEALREADRTAKPRADH
jgi:hypothetical protein